MDSFAMLHLYGDWGLVALRIGLAAIFMVHGTKKWPMWNVSASAQLPSGMLWNLRALSIAEPLGAIAILFGFFTQAAAIGFVLVMIGAIVLKMKIMKVPFVNLDMSPGWEFELIILVSALAVVFSGAGAYSLDRMFFGI